MEKQTAKIVATVLGVLGIALILAGPAFHLVESTPALFAGLVLYVLLLPVPLKNFLRRQGNKHSCY